MKKTITKLSTTITLYSKSDFKDCPWKNGKGVTKELLKSGNGTAYDWRLSIATVDEDGEFSDFSGYNRVLFLLSGSGIHLQHNGLTESSSNFLNKQGQAARFNGGWKTTGKLVSKGITDFNLIANNSTVLIHTAEFISSKGSVTSPAKAVLLFYSLSESSLRLDHSNTLTIPESTLLRVDGHEENVLSIESGEGFLFSLLHKA